MYVFDTSSFSALFKYYPSRFPSLWTSFNSLVKAQRVISVMEVFQELNIKNGKQYEKDWIKQNKNSFLKPTSDEAYFLMNKLFQDKNCHFQNIISQAKRLNGGLCADPFIIAKAQSLSWVVVTEEQYKPHGVKIPTICEYYDVECINLEGFMTREQWVF